MLITLHKINLFLLKKNLEFKNLILEFKNEISDLTVRNIYRKNWIIYRNYSCSQILNALKKTIVVNYEKYNYNFIQYMCKLKHDIKISILDFCSTVSLFIPHYCYHPDLSIAGNCRMCLIQLDGSIKPVVSCAIIFYQI